MKALSHLNGFALLIFNFGHFRFVWRPSKAGQSIWRASHVPPTATCFSVYSIWGIAMTTKRTASFTQEDMKRRTDSKRDNCVYEAGGNRLGAQTWFRCIYRLCELVSRTGSTPLWTHPPGCLRSSLWSTEKKHDFDISTSLVLSWRKVSHFLGRLKAGEGFAVRDEKNWHN